MTINMDSLCHNLSSIFLLEYEEERKNQNINFILMTVYRSPGYNSYKKMMYLTNYLTLAHDIHYISSEIDILVDRLHFSASTHN